MNTFQIIGICLIALVIFYTIYNEIKKRKQKKSDNKSEETKEESQKIPQRNNYRYIIFIVVILVSGYFIWNHFQDKTVEIPLSSAVELSKSSTFSSAELEYSGSYNTLKLIVADNKEIQTQDINDEQVTLSSGETITSDVGYIGIYELKDLGFVFPEKYNSTSVGIGIDWGNILYILAMLGFFYLLFSGKFGSLFGGNIEKFKPDKSVISFNDIGGMGEVKESLKEVVAFLKDREHFNNLGAKVPKGILLEGSPGTGKTMLASAVAFEAGMDFYPTTGSEFHNMFVGVAAQKVKKLFKQAKKNPSIIFIDEFDSLAHSRSSSGSGEVSREWNHTLNQLLAEMDGFDKNTNLVVIAATNRADVLDPAVLRAGRFDRKIFVPLPNYQDRIEILKIHIKNKPVAEGINVESIARQTSGFSGADLALLLNEASILAGGESSEVITNNHIVKAMDKVLAGDIRRSFKYTEKEKSTVAYHESGHALVATMLPEADKVQRISILPRGHAGGFTRTANEREELLFSKEKLLSTISVLLAGRASEEIFLSTITSGAQNDLQRANELAKEMVEKLGMGENYGLRYTQSSSYGLKDSSIEGQRIIDKDIKEILDGCYMKAKEILISNKEKLNALVQKLIEVESVNIEDIINILH
jgi:cell division protease FtsH